MWEKLLEIFRNTNTEEEDYVPPSIAKREARWEELASQVSQPQESERQDSGKGALIGFDYLKGLKDDEDDNTNIRRFVNLNKLLRGNYENGKIEATTTESQENIRRKDS